MTPRFWLPIALRVLVIGVIGAAVGFGASPARGDAQMTCSVRCPNGSMSEPIPCTSSYVPMCLRRTYPSVPQGPSPDELRVREQQLAQQQLVAQQQEAERARMRHAAEADQLGMDALNRHDWNTAVDRFSEGLRIAPEDPALRAHLVMARDAFANAAATETLVVLRQRTDNAIATANLAALRISTENAIIARRLAALSRALAEAQVHRPRVIYAALRPVSPDSPPGKVLARAQLRITALDQRIRGAQIALRRIIRSNEESEAERVEWTKQTEEVAVDAKEIGISLAIDLVGASVDELSEISHDERGTVLNGVLSRASDNGPRNSIHSAYGMMINRRTELRRIASEVELLDKVNQIRARVEGPSLAEDREYTRQDGWDAFSQIKRVSVLTGPGKDLLDAAYTICRQAVNFQRLARIRTNQEATLRAAGVLRAYILRLQAQKDAPQPSA